MKHTDHFPKILMALVVVLALVGLFLAAPEVALAQGELIPPETILTSTPANPSLGGVTFTFSSDNPLATFECQLDAGGWTACTSPMFYYVLSAEEHTFQVRAGDVAGNVDATPASFPWTVAEVEPVPASERIISAGYYHTCALLPSGAVDCWGYNYQGQAEDRPGPYTQVGTGEYYTCALTPSGAVECWGANGFGQAIDRPGPYTQLSVSAGYNHNCALTPSGAVDCWGDNEIGQAVSQPGPYIQVSAGRFHTCALTPSGAVDCWGQNNYGQAVNHPGPYTQVSAGGWHTCALTPSGAVDCWGAGETDANAPHYGQSVDRPGPYIQVSAGHESTCALTPSGAVDCWGLNTNGRTEDQPGPFIQVSVGFAHTCAMAPSGAVHCWGAQNYYDQVVDLPGPYGPYGGFPPETTLVSTPANPSLGGVTFTFSSSNSSATFACSLDGSAFTACTSPKTYLVLSAGSHTFQVQAINLIGSRADASPSSYTWTVASVTPVSEMIVSAGMFHTCALTPSGTVDCWGAGETNIGYNREYGQSIDQSGPYIQVSTGERHTCALAPSGAVDCWGDNYWGQANNQPGPYTQVSVGYAHTCALTPSGAVDCWGDNSFGKAEDMPGPYIQISASSRNTCALTPSGAVNCWGDNLVGQATNQPGPYIQVSSGLYHTCALTPSGAVDCWGEDFYGKTTDQPGPYLQISAGHLHTCALTPSGAVDCWGYNEYGQATNQPGPYTQISAGHGQNCALTPSGAVDCWGLNYNGQAEDRPGPYGPYAPNDPPVLTGIHPASAVAGSGDLTLTVTGSSFIDGSTVRWNGADLVTTYVNSSELSALIAASNLVNVQTAQVTVYTPAPGGGTSEVLAFFVTQTDVEVTGQEVASGTDPNATSGPATATATGEGLLAVAQYNANPGGTLNFTANGAYFDVYAAPENTFTEVSIIACGMNPNDKLFWWDAGQDKWQKASPQSFVNGCITLRVTDTSSPSLSQLQGTFFAAGNTAPLANPAGPYLAAINTAIPFDGSLSSDSDGDPLSYDWTFGGGSAGNGAQPSHSYTAAGIYDVCLTVNDGSLDSAPACTLVVVYDPSAGFVTGGGWFDSPAGAYIPDPTLSGKATFGFVSKYLKGTTVPTGTTEFQFQAGSFSFTSTAYEWLVVDRGGTNAQFKGSGTVNGSLAPNGSAYKFMIRAGDGLSTASADTFQIKIWWEASGVENVVYDNGTSQAIGGGSIIVHVSK